MFETIRLVSVADDNYAQHLGVMLCSIFESNKTNDLDVHVIDGGITTGNKEKLINLSHGYSRTLHFHKIDPRIYGNFSRYSTHLTPAPYYRLSIPEIIDKKIEKILYLDCDIVVIKDLKPLWETDIEGYLVAAVVDDGMATLSQYTGCLFSMELSERNNQIDEFKQNLKRYCLSSNKMIDFHDSEIDHALSSIANGSKCELLKDVMGNELTLKKNGKKLSLYNFKNSIFVRLGIPKDHKYFNSGVLLMNLKKWRENKTREKTVEFLQKNKDAKFLDQDALNGVLYGKWLELPGKYNIQCDDRLKETPDAVIIHYLCIFKPWYLFASFPYAHHYSKYLKMTPWKDFKPKFKKEHLLFVNYLLYKHFPSVKVFDPIKKKLAKLIPR